MVILPVLLFLPALTTAHFLGLLQNLTSSLNEATITLEFGTGMCESFLLNATGSLLTGAPLISLGIDSGLLSGLTSLDMDTRIGLLPTLFNRTSWLPTWRERFGALNFTLGSGLFNWRNRFANLNVTLGSGPLATLLDYKINKINATLQNMPLLNLFSG
ncbi:uncharacterized protein LOC122263190 [Penaeus japonicus]|uniref:uncharacterized protein LOC122263190 n=1 Tax=Penaeus japonicus TaxID=27405 RepID=UPI001C717765|nr:uncharacterized protein LOC122263190 [Penaeus japonicus]